MLSLNGAISRYYFEYKDDKDKLKEFWGTNILFIIINSVIITSILLIFHRYLLMPFTKNISFYPYLAIALISITLNPIYSIFQSTLQAQQNGKQFGLNNLSYFITNLLLSVLFVVGFKFGAKGVLLATAVTDVIFFIYTLTSFIPKVKLKINKVYLKQALKYSMPLIPHSLAGWMMVMLDRIFLNNMKSTEVAGSYNVGSQFGNIMNMLTTAVNQAYVPWFFDNMTKGEEGKRSIIKFSEYAVVAYGLIAMMISLFTEEVMKILVSSKFGIGDGWKVVPLITFAFVFNGIYYFFVNPLFYNEKGTKYIPIGTFFSAIMNSVLNLVLIPKYGAIGASVASLVSMLLASILILIISRKIEKIEFNYIKLYMITAAFMIISSISYLSGTINFEFLFVIKVIVTIIVLIILGRIYKKEILSIKASLQNRFIMKGAENE
jgi:O-antigen/teichoic acid export membrane protein